MKKQHYLLLTVCLIVLTACGTPTPAPNSDSPILTGPESLPKALATVAPSATKLIVPTPTNDGSRPTATLPPPTNGPTPTPMVGTFLGIQTFPAVEGTFTWIPTHGPKVVIVTARPGSRTPPPQLIAAIPSAGAAFPPISTGLPPVQGGTPGVVRACSTPVAPQFANAFNRTSLIGDRIGCPAKAAFGLRLVTQPFQNGVMFWRESKEMFALTNTNIYYRVMDTWNDTIPANDPALVPPAGFQQPVRGFGYAWRSNATIKNSLGWALSNEVAMDGTWQDFERGFMITGSGNTVYALIPANQDGGQHLGTLTN